MEEERKRTGSHERGSVVGVAEEGRGGTQASPCKLHIGYSYRAAPTACILKEFLHTLCVPFQCGTPCGDLRGVRYTVHVPCVRRVCHLARRGVSLASVGDSGRSACERRVC